MTKQDDLACECGKPARCAVDPLVPVEFDAEMNEYHLLCNGGNPQMHYCFWCGGHLPKSNRDLYFTEPSASEMAEVQELLKEARSYQDVLTILGPADELCDSKGSCATPGHASCSRWEQQYRYTTRWKSLELWVPLVVEGSHWSIHGHELAEPRSREE